MYPIISFHNMSSSTKVLLEFPVIVTDIFCSPSVAGYGWNDLALVFLPCGNGSTRENIVEQIVATLGQSV